MIQRQPPAPGNGKRSPQPESPPSPILSEAAWTGRQAPVRAHVALVVVYHAGNHQLLWPHDRRRVLLHKRPTTVYEVDLGAHHTDITADLPSGDNAGAFHATISVEWRVLNPSTVVRHQVTDVGKALLPHLLYRARRIARGFGIDQAAEAEDEINRQLGSHTIDVTDPATYDEALQQAAGDDRLGAEYGLWTRILVQLTLDEAAIEHNAKMAQLNWAIEEEKVQHRLRVLQEANQQQIMAERIAVYREIVAAGDREQFAMQLALHPGDISAIAKIIKDEQLTSRRETIDFVHHMVESGVIERWEVSDQAREALQWLKDATARVIHERDQQAAPQARQGRGEPITGDDAPQQLPEAAGTPTETIVVEPSQAQGPDPGGTS